MICSFLIAVPLSTLATSAPSIPDPLPLTGTLPRASDVTADAIRDAGDDVGALLKLAVAWAEGGSEASAVMAWERVLEIDPDHEDAHRGLRHHLWNGTWYSTYTALSSARRKEVARRLKEDGVVPFGEEWVLPGDLPFRKMNWEAVPTGGWAPPGTAARLADDATKKAAGWERQHRTWISPTEFDQWRSGLWKVGDEWLTVEDANKVHAELDAWWEVPGEHFVALTTVPEEDARWVVWWADQVHGDLQELFGLEPESAPEFVVLNSIAQYNEFSAGSTTTGRNPADASGYSSLHYAYFTDGWYDRSTPVPQFRASAAAYYDINDPGLKPYGQHAVRHAATLAWLESVDPSWDTVAEMVTSGALAFPDAAYWGEKRIPRWLRYGAAAYCERFFEDKSTPEGGDPLWARKWALENLRKGGDLDPIESILTLDLQTSDPEGSARLIHEAGLLVHYIRNGGDKKMAKAWAAFREALVGGSDTQEAAARLEALLLGSGKKVAAFYRK